MTKRFVAAFIWSGAALLGMPLCQAQTFTVELTRFGGCIGQGCVVEIADNGPLDNDNTIGLIDFSQPIVGQAPNVFSAAGIATETIGRDTLGNVTSIFMNLTDATVGGEAGASTNGQIGLISSQPLVSLGGVSGFASLNGQYQTGFATGVIGNADILLQARLGGVLLGLVDPPPGNGGQSPVPFQGFNARSFNRPVANKLFGVFDFTIGSNDEIFLPGSGEVLAVIPEPSSFILLIVGAILASAVAWRRRRDK